MHKHFVANIVSRITLVVCLVLFLPLGWAVHDDPHSREVKAFILTIFIGTALSALVLAGFRIKKDDTRKISAKDGLAVVGLSWIFLSLIGAAPFFLAGVVGSYTDAFFEVVSGFTTTGATVFADVEALPRGILFWRSLTHWLGGMGIIVLYIALLPALGMNTFQLYKAESPGLTVERAEPRIKETAKNLWMIYFLFSFLEVMFLMVGGMPFFDAVCHTFGTMATGGFSTKNTSIAAYDPYIQWVIILFMFLAGTSFVMHYQAVRGRPIAPFGNEEFRTYFLTVVVLVPVFALGLEKAGASAAPVRDAAFQVVAILTTTGYATADFSLWPHALQFVLVLLMFIGGCGGSTGGGLKVVRVLLSIKIAARSVVQSVFPNAVLPVRFSGKAVPDRMVLAVLAYFTVFMFLFFGGSVLFLLLESLPAGRQGCDLVTAMTATVSALSNIGPGLGAVGPVQNYAWISVPGKWLLSFLMLAGRLELYSILVLFVPDTWRK